MYNKTAIVQKGYKTPLELYRAGEWNWDTFAELAKNMTDKDKEIYGFGCEDPVLQAFLASTKTDFVKIEGTTIKNEDIASHYVWIPRFAYKLWNVTGSAGIDSYNAYNKGIEIIFENGTETSGMISCQNNICYNDPLKITKVTNNDNGKYYTHPAFTDQEKALTGIWVSKYEISTNSDNCNNNDVSGCLSDNLKIESKSGNTAWRNNHLSNYYKNIKTIANHHIIKNTEWGAISYLTHSKYGLCKDNKCSEIGSNKTYISGADIKDSTTNNMYGVFDLAGSASEFVMGNYTTDLKNINLTKKVIEFKLSLFFYI